MAKSIKFKNDTYLDSKGIVHNKKILSTIIDGVNSKLSDDVLDNCNNVINGICLFPTNSSTLNTPYKQGITTATQGMIISSVNGAWGVQLALQQGDTNIFLRVKGSGNWYSWSKKGG